MIPISIKKIIEQEKELLKKDISEINKNKILFSINPNDFKELFLVEVNRIIAKRNIEREFTQTKENKDLINQIYYYCTGDSKFDGSHEKGIMIVGKNGVGKTIILRAYCNIIELIGSKIIKYIHAKKLISEIRKEGLSKYEKKPLFIDDIGKESKEINDFGTISEPLADLIALRYDNGSLTFATSNYNIQTLSEFYGVTTTDRFKEMFNIITLNGESFRK